MFRKIPSTTDWHICMERLMFNWVWVKSSLGHFVCSLSAHTSLIRPLKVWKIWLHKFNRHIFFSVDLNDRQWHIATTNTEGVHMQKPTVTVLNQPLNVFIQQCKSQPNTIHCFKTIWSHKHD